MSEKLGGLSVNGKHIVIGASDESIEVSPNLMIGGRRSDYRLAQWYFYRFTRYTLL